MKTPPFVRSPRPVLLTLLGCSFIFSASAADITDFALFSIEATAGDDQLYGYTSMAGTPTLLTNLPTTLRNGLAADLGNNRLLFLSESTTSTHLAEYDFVTGTVNQLGDISASFDISDTSGGGTFYDGSYFYWDDEGADTAQGLVRVDFDSNGDIASTTDIYVGNYGDFGDLVISDDGTLYGVSNAGSGNMDFWSAPLSNVANQTMIQTDVAYQQLAYDISGKLYGVDKWDDTNRRWYEIDTTDGSVITTIVRDSTQNAVDLAGTGAIQIVPEPSTVGLFFSGVLLLIFRRRP